MKRIFREGTRAQIGKKKNAFNNMFQLSPQQDSLASTGQMGMAPVS